MSEFKAEFYETEEGKKPAKDFMLLDGAAAYADPRRLRRRGRGGHVLRARRNDLCGVSAGRRKNDWGLC